MSVVSGAGGEGDTTIPGGVRLEHLALDKAAGQGRRVDECTSIMTAVGSGVCGEGENTIPGGVRLEQLALDKAAEQDSDAALRATPPPADPSLPRGVHMVHWFRKGLRLHDNPALRDGLRCAITFRCIFIIDPWFAGSSNVGINKWRFLLQCLEDLDASLRKLNSRLFVVRGQPADALPKLFKEWGTTALSFEEDPEPFGRVRDHNITAMCRDVGIEVVSRVSHTLYKLDTIIERNGGRAPLTYHQFQALVANLPPPPSPEPAVTAAVLGGARTPLTSDHDDRFGVPTLEELGFDTDGIKPPVWIGGEGEALARLDRHLERKAWVASFGRPKMTPQSLLASQTGLSPYLRFGCLSTRLFYYQLTELYKRVKHARPPLSLHGQLLWREFFYCAATRNPNFDRMVGNPICVQIPWDKNPDALAKWANAQTGYPWIDAVMTQLREEGWIHHLARHAVACFLTRGDLWLSWEEGMKVFEELLLDADWSVNAGMWMWLSCSSFFQQFFHCYCPVRFGRKADPNGDFIKKYLPVLVNMPALYIHEPWVAPASVQCAARCVIGRDYPLPMVDHNRASQLNIQRIKQVYQHLAKYQSDQTDLPSIQQTTMSVQSQSPATVITHVNQSNYLSNINSDYKQSVNIPNKYKPPIDDYSNKQVPDIFQKQEQDPHVHKSIPFKHVVIIPQPTYKELCDDTQSLENYSGDKPKTYLESDTCQQQSVIEYTNQKSQNYPQNVERCDSYEMRDIMMSQNRQYEDKNESDRNVIQHNNAAAASGKMYEESNSKYYMQSINNTNNLEFDSSMDGSQFPSYPQHCYNNQTQYGNYADVEKNSYENKNDITNGEYEHYGESFKESMPFNRLSGTGQIESGKLCGNKE